MKKIGLLMTADPHDGGSYQYNLYLLNALLKITDYELHVVVLHPFWCALLDEEKVPYHVVHYGACWRWILAAFRRLRIPMTWQRAWNSLFHPVARYMRAQGYDLWICPAQDAWSYQVNVSTLVSIHDLMHRYETAFPEISNPEQYAAREYHYGNICKFAKGVLVDSEMGKQQVIECYGCVANKIHVLPLSVPEYLSDPHFDQEAAQVYAHLPSKFFFYPAQFWEHKNHKNLIRAIGILKEIYPDIHLVLSGSQKNGYASAQALCHTLGLENHITFLGYVPDKYMRYLYTHARAMAMASFCGPTNTPIPEAISLGCPVAVSRVYAMPDQAGTAGLTFDPHNPQEIATTLSQLWEDEALYDYLKAQTRILQKEIGSEPFLARVRRVLQAL